MKTWAPQLRLLADRDCGVPALLQRFPEISVLVVGDTIYDAYLDGHPSRLAREEPVPVVAIEDHRDAAGGAANAAVNLAELGARVTFCSVIGDDGPGARVLEILRSHGVAVRGVLASAQRRTCAKRRLLASGRMLVRFDEGSEGAPAPEEQMQVRTALTTAMAESDAVLVSDYGAGVVTDDLIRCLSRARGHRPLFVDSRDPRRFRGAQPVICVPSFGEISPLIQPAVNHRNRGDAVAASAELILDETGSSIVVVTLDRDGAIVIRRGHPPHHVSGDPVLEQCSTGAGDTFTAALALATVAGADPITAAQIASAAAGVVVAKPGTATCRLAELRLRLVPVGKVLADLDALRAIGERHRRERRRVIFTNGCFDIIHRGHVALLDAAKRLGDVLVVALNSDASVRRLKGPSRPVNTLADRTEVLAALACVDHIVAFDEDEPTALIQALRPDVLVKGGDYTEDTIPEAALVRSLGGTVQILGLVPERSTTGIIERVRLSIAR